MSSLSLIKTDAKGKRAMEPNLRRLRGDNEAYSMIQTPAMAAMPWQDTQLVGRADAKFTC